MKTSFLTLIALAVLGTCGLHAQEFGEPKKKVPFSNLKLPNLGFSKLSKVPDRVPSYLAPYAEFDLIQDCWAKPEKVVKLNTTELSRRAFTKWEEHCCGIKIQGNYMKVTYQTFFSDGSSVIWEKEFRS